MTPANGTNASQTSDLDDAVDRVLTIPNVITIMRLGGSCVLLWLAYRGLPVWFAWLFGGLLLTDWLDGKIAIWFHQRTVLGARLDSIADAVLYGCLIIGMVALRPDYIRSDAILIVGMLTSYALPVIITVARFGRLPAYHTRAAKTCWFLVSIGAISLLVGGPMWPARAALICVIITNIEAAAISCVVARWEADIPSILHAHRLSRKGVP